MFQNWLKNLLIVAKLLAVLAIPIGLVVAGIGWFEGRRVADVLGRGVEAQARIEGGTRTTGRRSGTSHRLNLSWAGPNNTTLRAEGVRISAGLANQLIVGERIVRARAAIKYVGDDAANPVVLEDADYQLRSNANMVTTGLAIGGVGAVLTGLMVWRARRRRTLAQTVAA